MTTDYTSVPNRREMPYRPAEVQYFLGISRSVLNYWVEQVGLGTTWRELPGITLFDFSNLLNLGLIITLADIGLRSSEVADIIRFCLPKLGPRWSTIKKYWKNNPVSSL